MKTKTKAAKKEGGARALPRQDAAARDSLERRISELVRRYSPSIQAQLSAARELLRAHFPRGYELVFDNYNALVFGFSPTERSSDSFLSVAGYPRWVTLFFLHGAQLKDPRGLLEGSGKQVRSIRLKHAEDIEDRHVRALIAQALAPRKALLAEAPALTTLIKSVVTKQRPRRP